jgi:hypothetical protein
MDVTDSQKQQVRDLIAQGKKLKAVRHLQDHFDLTAEQALALTEQVAQEMEKAGLDTQLVFQQEIKSRVTNSLKDSKIPKVIGSIFTFFGLCMLGVVVYVYVTDSSFIDQAILIEGKCTGYDSYESSDDNGGSTTMYTAIFTYAYQGEEFTHYSGSSSSSQDYDYDEVVEIYIDPNNPADALVNSFWERWFIIILLGFMGTLFSGLGLMAILLFGRSNSATSN